MKLLFFYTHNRSFLAGFFVELLISLQERGWEIHGFSLKNESGKIEEPFPVDIIKKSSYLKNSYDIYKVIKSYQPDVVVAGFNYSNAAIISGKLLGVKRRIIWTHTVSEALETTPYRLWRKSKIYKLSTRMFSNSDILKRDLIENYAVPAEKIHPIPFWSPLEKEDLKTKERQEGVLHIGVPGRIEETKNQQIVLELLRSSKFPVKIKCYFAGSGTADAEMKEMVERYGLGDKVEFLGVLKIAEMHTFYKEMDVVILPSRFEAFGLVLIEALSIGCPVLVSDSHGALNFIEDENFRSHFVFDPDNLEDLRQKLFAFIEDDSRSFQYFRKIYQKYFIKEEIVNLVERLLR